jgi:hypothetical protein
MAKTKPYYAYVHFKPDDTPFYVGKGNANRLASKWRYHNSRHTRTLKKYGVENIGVARLECSSNEIAVALEVGLIKRLRLMGVDLANNTPGGEGSPGVRSKESREVMAAAQRRVWQNPEHRRKMSEAHKGKGVSEYVRECISKAHRGTIYITNGDMNKRVRSVEEIPEGWRRGKTEKSRKNRSRKNDGVRHMRKPDS